TTSVRGSDWAGMPSASPIASPYSAPSARDLISCITNSLPAVIPALTGPVAPAHADDHGDMAVGAEQIRIQPHRPRFHDHGRISATKSVRDHGSGAGGTVISA